MQDLNDARNNLRPNADGGDSSLRSGISIQRDDDYLTIQEVAQRTGVSRAFVLSWIKNGYITAKTSKRGWLIRVGDIEDARRGAEDARSGNLVDSHHDHLENNGDAEEDTLVQEVRQLPRPVTQRLASDALVTPFAEFVRDQADIVQEQAETIGWLQAELRRARDQIKEYESRINQVTGQTDNRVDKPVADRYENTPSSPLDIIVADPFSDEAAQARMMIEETERKITDMWEEHAQRRSRHMQSQHSRQSQHDKPADNTWIRRIVSSWKRQDAL